MERTYIIKKGKHTSRILKSNGKTKMVPIWNKFWFGFKKREYKIILNEQLWYKDIDIPYSGINKFLGFGIPIHEEWIGKYLPFLKKRINSIVLGWMPGVDIKDDIPHKVFKLYSYYDINGIEFRNYECSIPIDSTHICASYEISKRGYSLMVWDDKGALLFTKGVINLKLTRFGYNFQFYFGGKSTAPHDMTVKIKRIR